ncbi:MAG: sigma-54-dependent Fis family transcriptional regulator [Chitinophagaceae bacterium]|nr:MAG: sigma-54-dependent Fis family transcriptional regulator [Chitinophagaceae bacterium]
MMKKILIAEDQFIEANNLQLILQKAGYEVTGIARSVSAAIEMVDNNEPDLVLLDIYLKGPLTGIDLARKLRQRNIGFVYLSANSNEKTLNEAKVTQPYGFLVKPFREKDILVTLDIAWYQHEQFLPARRNNDRTGTRNTHPSSIAAFNGIVGSSAGLKQVLDNIQVVAPVDTTVLILGESGTGKEQVASAIHKLSPRKNKPFVKVNCAALSTTLIESELFGHERGSFTGATDRRIGRFEQANGGSLFLDEIGEMPLETQSKMLRVLQEKELERIGGRETIRVDVRIIAATNRDLQREVAEGRFRMDLYYRLHVFPIQLPALRDRKEDIPALAMNFLRSFAAANNRLVKNFKPECLEQLIRYNWPGNIREMQNLIERSVLLCKTDTITEISLPEPARVTGATINPVSKGMEQVEREHIIEVLTRCNGKLSGSGGAAELLQLPLSTLNYKLRKYGISREISILNNPPKTNH